MLERFFRNKCAHRWMISDRELILVTFVFLFTYFLKHLFPDFRGVDAIVLTLRLYILIFGVCVLFFPAINKWDTWCSEIILLYFAIYKSPVENEMAMTNICVSSEGKGQFDF